MRERCPEGSGGKGDLLRSFCIDCVCIVYRQRCCIGDVV